MKKQMLRRLVLKIKLEQRNIMIMIVSVKEIEYNKLSVENQVVW